MDSSAPVHSWRFTEDKYIVDQQILDEGLVQLQQLLGLKDSSFCILDKKGDVQDNIPFCLHPLLEIRKTYEKGYDFFQADYLESQGLKNTDETKLLYYIYNIPNIFMPELNFNYNLGLGLQQNQASFEKNKYSMQYQQITKELSAFQKYALLNSSKVSDLKVLLQPQKDILLDPGILIYYQEGKVGRFQMDLRQFCGSDFSTDPDTSQVIEQTQSLYFQKLPSLIKHLEDNIVIPVSHNQIREEFHNFGVNLRLMGVVAREVSFTYLKEIFVEEMISRSLKKIFYSNLHRVLKHNLGSPKNQKNSLNSPLENKKSRAVVNMDQMANPFLLENNIQQRQTTVSKDKTVSSKKRESSKKDDEMAGYLKDFVWQITSMDQDKAQEIPAFWDQIVKPQVLRDYLYQLSDFEIRNLNKTSTFCRMQNHINFNFEGDLKSLQTVDLNKQESFYNQSHFYFVPYSFGPSINNGIIDEYGQVILFDNRYSLEEKVIVSEHKIACYDLENEFNGNSDILSSLQVLTNLCLKQENTDSFAKAQAYASKAASFTKDLHLDNVFSILLQIKIGFAEKQFEDVDQKIDILVGLLKLYKAENHPMKINIFDELGELYLNEGEQDLALNFFLESFTCAKSNIGINHTKNIDLLRKIGEIRVYQKDFKQALYDLKVRYQIMKANKMQNCPDMSTLSVDLVRISKELGKIDDLVELAVEGLKIHREYFDRHSKQFEVEIYERETEFQIFLDNFYQIGSSIKSAIILKVNDSIFIKNVLVQLQDILILDLKKFEHEFLQGKIIVEKYKNRVGVYQDIVTMACYYCILSFNHNIKRNLLFVILNFEFNFLEGSEQKKLSKSVFSKSIGKIYKATYPYGNNDNKYVQDMIETNLKVILSNYKYLKQVYEERNLNPDLKTLKNEDNILYNSLEELKYVVNICGFINFKNFLMDIVDEKQMNQLQRFKIKFQYLSQIIG